MSNHVPTNGGAGMPAGTSLAGLSLLTGGDLQVTGSFGGNSLTEDPATTPWPYPIVTGSNFVATYTGFFGQWAQSPSIVTY